MARSTYDVLFNNDILHKPLKRRVKAWRPLVWYTQLLCPKCCTMQVVEAYDNKTGLATLRCKHQRGQTL